MEQINALDTLRALPIGAVLRHPRGGLVEILGDHLRIDGNGIAWNALMTSWDFPMELLYNPTTTKKENNA